MKTHDTFPGRSYSVHSTAGCTVSDDSGWSKELAAPEDYFTAHGGKVYLSDNAASVKELFKLAPYQKLRLLGVVGGNDGLPAGYTRLAYLESTGAQWIRVNVEYDSFAEIGAYCEYVDLQASQDAPIMSLLRNGNGNNRFYVPYCAKNTIYTGFYDWITLGQGSNKDVRTVAELNLYASNMYRISYADVKLEGRLPSPQLVNVNNMPMMLFGYATLVDVRPCFAQVFYALITKNKVLIHKFVPVVTTSGEPCLFDTVSGQSFYNVGSGQFIAGVETQTQLNNMLRRLPDRTGQEVGTLQVRLAEALQTPENLSKLDAMVAKNWEISQAA